MARDATVNANGNIVIQEEAFDVDGDHIFLNYVQLKSIDGAPAANNNPSWLTFNTNQQVDPDGTRRRFVDLIIDPVGLSADTSYVFELSCEDSQSDPVLHTVELYVGLIESTLIYVVYKDNSSSWAKLTFSDTSYSTESGDYDDTEAQFNIITIDPSETWTFFVGDSDTHIYRRKADGSAAREEIVTSPELSGNGNEHWVWPTENKIYWPASNINAWRRADHDGSNVENIVTSASQFLGWGAIDPINQLIFWCTNGSVYKASFGGTPTNFYSMPDNYHRPFIDPFVKQIWLLDGNSDGVSQLYQIDYDGNLIRTWFNGGDVNGALDWHRPIAVDPANQKIYMQEIYESNLRRFAYDGTNEQNHGNFGGQLTRAFALLQS